MKKNLTSTLKLTCAFLLFFSLKINSTYAQYVLVADPNFAAWLQTNYPNCMSGNFMDTTCTAIVNETNLVLPTYFTDSLTNISEIKYFDGLQKLIVQNNYVQIIDRFPVGLKKIYILGNLINTIPALPMLLDTLMINHISQNNNILQNLTFPNSLIHIELVGNNLSGFLPPLPPNLITLNVGSNPFWNSASTDFLNNLPASLQSLGIADCGINFLPQTLPNLVYLNCGFNEINEIASLPASLFDFNCSYNNLSQLPPLPNGLFVLSAENNAITSLPDTLPPNLGLLFIANNQIDSIPDLPVSVNALFCDGNPITELPNNFAALNNFLNLSCSNCSLTYLPAIPNVISLNCSNNQISCVGLLSTNLIMPFNLDLSNNPFTCVPNYVIAMDSAFVAAHPLCVLGDTVNNPYNCSIASGIAGTIFNDNNNDCLYNTGDNILNNVKVNFFNPINSEFSSTFSGNSGVFFNILTPSVYLTTIDTTSDIYTFNCLYPGLDTMVTTTIVQPLADDVNFAIKCKPGFDLGVQSIAQTNGIPFPGQLHTMKIVAGDISQWYNLNCGQGISGQVTLTLSGPVSLASIEPTALTPSSILGNVLSYNIADFGNLDINSAFVLNLLTDTTAQTGDQICIQAAITSTGSDNNLLNNTFNQCYPAVNSYDPNFKMVNPINVEPGYNDWFTYSVYFQNLGNAPAFNIRILDTLDQNLNVNSFEVIGYSHANNTTVNNRIVTVRFPNIMLPDSASNPSGSIGYIQYRIKPLDALQVGSIIENTAHIYFDFNPAIVTNTTQNEYVTLTSLQNKTKNNSNYTVFPNPATNELWVAGNIDLSTAKLFDINGTVINFEYKQNQINLKNLKSGIYILRNSENVFKRFVKF